MKLTDYKALTFDCYGTLIDWETGILDALQPLTAQLSQVPDRDAILQLHAQFESSQQRWTPAMNYQQLLAVVYKRLAEHWGCDVTNEQCSVYGRSVKHWPAFDDSVEALRYLKQHYKLIVLSNVDNDNFSASNEKLAVKFDAVYTAEDIGSYKPSSRNFQYMLEKLSGIGLQKADILHTAESLFHDHMPAREQGLSNCWIYRRHDQSGYGATMDPGDLPQTDFTFHSMAQLVAAHQQELA